MSVRFLVVKKPKLLDVGDKWLTVFGASTDFARSWIDYGDVWDRPALSLRSGPGRCTWWAIIRRGNGFRSQATPLANEVLNRPHDQRNSGEKSNSPEPGFGFAQLENGDLDHVHSEILARVYRGTDQQLA